MNANWTLVSVLACCAVIIPCALGQVPECKKLYPCACIFPNNTVIDLSTLGFQNASARFQRVWDRFYASRYSYNPCYSFTDNDCQGVAVCQFNGHAHKDLGVQVSADFLTNSTTGEITVQYNSTDSEGTVHTTNVELRCRKKGPTVLEATGETERGKYKLHLTSEAACPEPVN